MKQKSFKSTKLMTAEDYKEFNSEMNRLSAITYKGYDKTLKEIGISYLCGCNSSSKIRHSITYNVLTASLYLASSDLSGINVCPKSSMCREACLSGSGHAKIDALSHKAMIEKSRITKTRLFFANRALFCHILYVELKRMEKRAERQRMTFGVRFNCTSDIDISLVKFNGKPMIELFPNAEWYDYTKVFSRYKLMEKYKNYHITFSRDGSEKNMEECKQWLSMGGNIAVVFGVTKMQELPKTYMGYKVICGDEYDARFLDKMDKDGRIVGLIYKVGKNDFKEIDGKHIFKGIPDIPFIIQKGDKNCEW